MPRQNHLIAALPAGDYERLLPDLEPIQLPLGWAVHIFVDAEVLVFRDRRHRFQVLRDGERGIGRNRGHGQGRRGIGVASIERNVCGPSRLWLAPARSYRIATELMTNERDRHRRLNHMLLRYTQALMTQIAQTAACNRHHSVDQIFRWILECPDRLPGERIAHDA